MVENGFKILLVNNSDYKSEPAGFQWNDFMVATGFNPLKK